MMISMIAIPLLFEFIKRAALRTSKTNKQFSIALKIKYLFDQLSHSVRVFPIATAFLTRLFPISFAYLRKEVLRFIYTAYFPCTPPIFITTFFSFPDYLLVH